MKFRTAYSEHVSIPSPSGSRYKKTYMRSSKEDRKLIETGVEDIYDTIQKAADGRTIADLIRRAERGDNTAIPPVVDSFVDLTHAPTSILEAHNMLADAKISFFLFQLQCVLRSIIRLICSWLLSVTDLLLLSSLERKMKYLKAPDFPRKK